jgi:hypothetical protein
MLRIYIFKTLFNLLKVLTCDILCNFQEIANLGDLDIDGRHSNCVREIVNMDSRFSLLRKEYSGGLEERGFRECCEDDKERSG